MIYRKYAAHRIIADYIEMNIIDEYFTGNEHLLKECTISAGKNGVVIYTESLEAFNAILYAIDMHDEEIIEQPKP